VRGDVILLSLKGVREVFLRPAAKKGYSIAAMSFKKTEYTDRVARSATRGGSLSKWAGDQYGKEKTSDRQIT